MVCLKIMAKNHNIWSILLWVGGFLLLGVLLFFILKPFVDGSAVSFWIGAIGGYSSLYGLVVMLVQFQSVRKTAEATRDKIYSVSSVSELSHYASLIRDASGDIERGSLEIARYKIQTVKDVIISGFCSSTNKKIDDSIEKRAQGFIVLLNNHISTLNNAILEKGVPSINAPVIESDMEKVCDFLQEMKNKQMKNI